MTYRLLEHTGDLGIEVRFPTLDGLFHECLRAQTDCLTRVDRIDLRETRNWALEAPHLPDLLVEFLSEAIYLFETEEIVLAAARVEVSRAERGWSLVGEVAGEPFDLGRHGLKTLLKAVTYHRLEVTREGEGWMARVIFDI